MVQVAYAGRNNSTNQTNSEDSSTSQSTRHWSFTWTGGGGRSFSGGYGTISGDISAQWNQRVVTGKLVFKD